MNALCVHHTLPHITFPVLDAELQRELERRHGFYPAQVRRGRMLQRDADRELALCQAWREDLQAALQWFARMAADWQARMRGESPERPQRPPAAHGIAWAARRAAVLRELALRRRIYPRAIETGELPAETAAHRIDCLEALLAFYELLGWDWRPASATTNGPDLLAEWEAIQAEVAARQPAEQKDLAL